MLANGRTGLLAPDVFYFGNLVGHTGRGGTFAVSTFDLARVRAKQATTGEVFDVRYDFDRSGIVDWQDLFIVRASLGHSLASLTPGQTATQLPRAASALAVGDRPASPPRRRAWEEVSPDVLA